MSPRVWSRLLLSTAVAAVGLLLAVGCGKSGSTTDKPPEGGAATEQPADIGSPLYPAAKDPVISQGDATAIEPIIVPGSTVQFEERQQIGAETDGKIEMLATPFAWNPQAKTFHEVRFNTTTGKLEEVPIDPELRAILADDEFLADAVAAFRKYWEGYQAEYAKASPGRPL